MKIVTALGELNAVTRVAGHTLKVSVNSDLLGLGHCQVFCPRGEVFGRFYGQLRILRRATLLDHCWSVRVGNAFLPGAHPGGVSTGETRSPSKIRSYESRLPEVITLFVRRAPSSNGYLMVFPFSSSFKPYQLPVPYL